jgi:hypothetical protein
MYMIDFRCCFRSRATCTTGHGLHGLLKAPLLICRFVQPFLQKYSDFPNTQIRSISPLSRPTEGRLAIVTDAGRDAVDTESALTNALEADGEVVWS